jgi:hypothetical protein
VAKREFDFTLILSGVEDLTAEFCNALYTAGCDDATPGMRQGTVFLDFTREAESFATAVASAIKDAERSRIGVRVTGVEPHA